MVELPKHLHAGLERYVHSGIPPGGFLRAVLCNDLRLAVLRADDVSRADLANIVTYLYQSVPSLAWGSPEAYETWIAHEGLDGLET